MNCYLPWKVDAVQDMAGMFNGCRSFKGRGIGNWNIENVQYMNYMFYGTYDMIEDLGSWNTRSVKQMEFSFYEASAFNTNISGWSVGNVKNLDHAFAKTRSFNQNLCEWGEQLPNDVYINEVFVGSGCDNATDPVTLSDGPWCRECQV